MKNWWAESEESVRRKENNSLPLQSSFQIVGRVVWAIISSRGGGERWVIRCDEELLLHKFLISEKLMWRERGKLFWTELFLLSAIVVGESLSFLNFPISFFSPPLHIFPLNERSNPSCVLKLFARAIQLRFGVGSTHRWLQFLQFFLPYQKLTIGRMFSSHVFQFFFVLLLLGSFILLLFCVLISFHSANIFPHWKTFSHNCMHSNRNRMQHTERRRRRRSFCRVCSCGMVNWKCVDAAGRLRWRCNKKLRD